LLTGNPCHVRVTASGFYVSLQLQIRADREREDGNTRLAMVPVSRFTASDTGATH